jgi:two-component system NtrC family sensor kinase
MGIGAADPVTHELISANVAFCELVGLPRDQVIGQRPPYPWWDGDDGPGRQIAFETGAEYDRVYRNAQGQPRPVRVSVHSVDDEHGTPVMLLALMRDVAGERRIQQQLVQSGKLAAIGELAAGVAHEINNPLFAILGLTEFLLQEAAPDSKAHERLELIQQTGLEIKEIVRALLDFARENSEGRQLVALDDVVRSTVDLVRRTNAHKGVEIIESYQEADLVVSASANQLKQVFLNLLANARQAMPTGGSVRIDVRREGASAVATVSDEGPGIDPEIGVRIFDPFFTTKRSTGGTGLGLSVSLGIAEAHGGSLTVASHTGSGAAFELCLPIAVPDESRNGPQ